MAEVEDESMNSIAGSNAKRRRVSTKEAFGAFLLSNTVTAISAGGGGRDDTGVPSDMTSTKPLETSSGVADAVRPNNVALSGDGGTVGKIGGGAIQVIGGGCCAGKASSMGDSAGHSESCHINNVGGASLVAVATDNSVISGMVRANKSNVITEDNYYILQWLYRNSRVSCARWLRIGFFRPKFLWAIYRPMMRSEKLCRTERDIRVAVNLWCSKRAAVEERYGHISDWDVSSVTDMNNLFEYKREINEEISRWDVSNVTNMQSVFWIAHAFNQAIGDWDVSKVANMNGMFGGAHYFNQPLGDWDVSKSKVIDMRGIFNDTRSFNKDLSRWDMRYVRGTRYMFDNALAMQRENKPDSLR